MKVYKNKAQSLLVKPFGLEGRLYLAATILLYFDLNDPDHPLSEQELWGTIPDQIGQGGILDLGMPKPHAEVLVTGKCHTPGGEPQKVSQVALKVGEMEKTLAVFGDRYWVWAGDVAAGIVGPQPFSEMPIAYEYAFGGEGFERNPLGRGIARVTAEDGNIIHQLPNLETPGNLVTVPQDRPDPAGFAPIDLMWPQRFEKQGTYDEKWQKERFPYFPDDMDYEFFNCAPEDQFIPGFFSGGESVQIVNMHPETSTINSHLPRLRVRCFVTRKKDLHSEEEIFREVETRIDTVWLFPNIMRGVLMYRGETGILDDEYDDVVRIFLATEKMGDEPGSAEHYFKEQQKAADLGVPVDTAPLEAAGKKINDALKRIKSLPKEIDGIRKRAMGKAPKMPVPSTGQMKAMSDRILAKNTAVLDQMEATARGMQAKWGHMANIPLGKFDQIRSRMAAMSKSVGQSLAKADTARKKAEDTSKELGSTLKKKLKPAQLAQAGIDPENLMPSISVNPWHDRGMPFVAQCRQRLEGDEETLNSLKLLGFEETTLRRAWIGINREDLQEPSADWGLAGGADDAGSSTPVALPAGLVVPRFDDATLNRILIRTADPARADGDMLVTGSDETPLFLPAATLIDLPGMPAAESAPCLAAPDDLQALWLEQEIGDACSIITLETADQPPGDDAAEALEAAPVLLVILKSRADVGALKPVWEKAFPNARLLPLPEGDTVFEAHRSGADIRSWIMAQLPEDIAQAHQVVTRLPEPGKPPAESPLAGMAFPKMDIKAMVAGLREEISAFHQPKIDAAEAQKKEMLDKAKEALRKADMDPEKVLAQTGAPEAGEKSLAKTGRIISDRLTAQRHKLREMGMLTPDLEKKLRTEAVKAAQMGEDAEKRYNSGMAQLAAAKEKLADAKSGKIPEDMKSSMSALGLDPDRIKKRGREEVIEMHGKGESLAGAILSGEDLSGLDLSGIDLSGAQCSKTNFSGSKLDGALLDQTLAQEAEFSGASLENAQSKKGIFSKAVFAGCRLRGVNFHMAVLREADLTGADCSDARLNLTILQKAKMSKAFFNGAKASMSVFSQADLSDADFKGASLAKCLFQGTTLDRCDFAGARINSCMFSGARGEQVSFQGADMSKARMGNEAAFPGADFSRAVLAQACFRESDLSGAQFRGSRLEMALLEKCDLKGADFYQVAAPRTRFSKSDLEGANLRGLNLFQGSLRKARLVGADFTGANLFSVDFYKAVVGNTVFEDANLKQAALVQMIDETQ